MIRECIILAGGLGTRLRSVVSDLPKCLAPVAGKPFLAYIIEHLQKQGIQNYIFSVGYKSEAIKRFLQSQSIIISYQLSTEDEPLGTGGAIKSGCTMAREKNILVLNGDTLFSIEVNKLADLHKQMRADCTLSLKPMQNFDRYGAVELGEDNSIKLFKEKQFYETGLINGGVYALCVDNFLNENLPDKFSFEKDYLEKKVSFRNPDKSKIYGAVQDEYFIDIGIPEDYKRAQIELK